MNTPKKKDKLIRSFGKNFFARFFGFEQGIDITNDVEVLYRRNIVIKNIIFVSNMMYSIILIVLSISTRGSVADWAITVVVFPITYVINKSLKKLIYTDTKDRTKQNVAMYVGALYIFISAILMYARLYKHDYLETAAYILVYYALVVISLYQDKKLLSSIFQSLLALLTIIHFIWTYNFHGLVNGQSIREFLPVFVTLPEFSDILLRTILFILVYLVLYAIVSMGQYMQEERKQELIKRRRVQSDFAHIVGNLFSVVLSSSQSLLDSKHAYRVSLISHELADLNGYSKNRIQDLEVFALVHLQYSEIKSLVFAKDQEDELSYEHLRGKTELGANIAKRIQLGQKCIDITRAVIEDTINDKFIFEMNQIQPEMDSKIILLADLYVTLRDAKPFKRPMSHQTVMKLFDNQLRIFFDEDMIDRFLKFHEDFEQTYHQF